MTAAPAPNDASTHSADEHWTGEELEAAYLRALEALDAVESEIDVTTADAAATAGVELPPPAATAAAEEPPVDDPGVSARQVIEACLFVGGAALTAAKLASILRGDYGPQFVEETIDDLNRQYLEEARPYEVRLGEGGYRLALRPEYERIQHKVYGLGPREVRLNQEALEVLALVAYQQPATEAQLAEQGKPECGAVLRQLLRRDLLAVTRDPEHPKDVRYVTTPRFLSLFGLGSLDDLPRPEEIAYK